MLHLVKKDNLEILQAKNFETLKWLQHGFTTRKGGISTKSFSSLNLGNTDDLLEYKNVLENRKILSKTIGFDVKNLTLAQQVHGNTVKIVTKEDIGKGSFSSESAILETDALVTNLPNVPIMLFYADCLPILIADFEKKVIGVVHAGWKGISKNILVETLKVFIKTFDSKKENLLIAMGICISKKNYEISLDVKKILESVNYSSKSFDVKDNKIFADLIEITKSQALNFGILEQNIAYTKEFCTYDNEDLFYSYRKSKNITGRHSAFIFIK